MLHYYSENQEYSVKKHLTIDIPYRFLNKLLICQ